MRIRQRLNPSLAPPQPSPTPQVARPISIPVEDPCHESMKKQVLSSGVLPASSSYSSGGQRDTRWSDSGRGDSRAAPPLHLPAL
uniref:Uncharacterized protein n=1 Tax=viral metagenome TaxID=1070528 RepID=A0A6C0J200_9ZZZZ